MILSLIGNFLLIVLGIGFVIFWHELGHFLAAKWAGVRVDQFAVGFGQALLCYRKGVGVTVGTSAKQYEERAKARLVADGVTGKHSLEQLDAAARAVGMSETEYRLNWIPLGGYVKMLGQDDMDPNSQSLDPRAYNMKPVGKRMVIVCAGVVMNVILAAVLFFFLFYLIGFRAPVPVVGDVLAGSPAQKAGLQVGDELLTINGHTIHDFTKVPFNVALLSPGSPAEVRIRRAGVEQAMMVAPLAAKQNQGMLTIGISGAGSLRGLDPTVAMLDESAILLNLPGTFAVRPGDRIVSAAGRTFDGVDPVADWVAFDQIVQQSGGKPIELVVVNAKDERRIESIWPRMGSRLFDQSQYRFAGLLPRTRITSVQPKSSLIDKVKPGDVILGVRGADGVLHPSPDVDTFIALTKQAGERNQGLSLTMGRGDDRIELEDVKPTVKVDENRLGFGLGVDMQMDSMVIASVAQESSAATAGLTAGATLVAIDGKPVSSWFEVHAALKSAPPDRPIELSTISGTMAETRTLKPTSKDIELANAVGYSVDARFGELTLIRKTDSPLTAIRWGAAETRDLILKGYLTLRRVVFDRSVPASNLVGFVGILHSGTLFTGKGWDWYVWFLAMISANLAVVNFLPIPIVDGGLFCFLLLEKITGKPPSPKLQSAAQLVGLVLILGLFLFVTYNDVVRLLTTI
jgi:regulator of sigma E protease